MASKRLDITPESLVGQWWPLGAAFSPSHPASCPAFHHDLLFRVEFDTIPTLGVQISEETCLPSAKGKIGDRSRDADIDPDVPRRRGMLELACGPAVRSK